MWRRRPDPNIQAIADAMTKWAEVAAAQAEATRAQAEAFTAFLKTFEVEGPPVARVMRPEDELLLDLQRDADPEGTNSQVRKWLSMSMYGDLASSE